MTSQRYLSIAALLLITACDATDASHHQDGLLNPVQSESQQSESQQSESQSESQNISIQEFLGDVLVIRDEDGTTFCEGTLYATIRAESLKGNGICGDFDVDLVGLVSRRNNTANSEDLSGFIQFYDATNENRAGTQNAEATTSAPITARLSGERTPDGLELIWSLEIPMPDDPPLDDDIYQLTASGDAWLDRQ